MNEQELRSAMRQAMSAQPPPMSDEPVLTAARRDLKRRRAMLASAGSAAAVVLVAVGVVVLAPAGADDGGTRVGGQPPSTTKSSSPVDSTDPGRAAALAAALDDLAPAGYETPDDLPGAAKYHNGAGIGESWSYDAITPLARDGKVGQLSVSVFGPGHPSTGEGCALSPTPWNAGSGTCTEFTVHGKKVGVVDKLTTQWAGFRYPDGTRVFAMQMPTFDQLPALDGLPMTREQLAAIVVDPRLKVQ